MSEVPTIALAGLSDAQKRALRLADNKIALGAGWDLDVLKLELADLAVLDVELELSVTGFSIGEIDVILKDPADPEDEVIPAVPVTPCTKPGDIWILGEHRIGCGDGRDSGFLKAVVGDGVTVDAAFLDPPYNVRINGHANAKGRHREFAMASGEMSDAACRAFLTDALSACARVSRDGAAHFVCMDWRPLDDVAAVANGIYGELLSLCVWNKSKAGMGSLYRSKHELIFVHKVEKAPHLDAVELGRHGRNRSNVWDYASVNSMAGESEPLFHADLQSGRRRRDDRGRPCAPRVPSSCALRYPGPRRRRRAPQAGSLLPDLHPAPERRYSDPATPPGKRSARRGCARQRRQSPSRARSARQRQGRRRARALPRPVG
jgi:hypothetical protein